MTSKEHKKHTALAKPSTGYFARNEWAILGAPCTVIKLLADDIIKALSPVYKCAYADTSHNDDITLLPAKLASGAILEFTDQLNYKQFNYNTAIDQFKLRQQFAETDIVLVNGNHQQAKAQVVIIDINKKASLQKRVQQLTNVQLLLIADNANDVFDFIKEAIPNWQQLPLYKLSETEKIIAFFQIQLQQAKPVLNGLVLSGGKSMRMGYDKALVNWHGKEQRYYMADMLKTCCNEVFISCRSDQKAEIDSQYLTLEDKFTDLGPYGALLSAFREKPDGAWLVIACDLPLMDMNTLQHLIANRDVSVIATSYKSSFDGFPEPLVAIWEPKSYPVLLSFLAQGYSCARKVLINSNIKLLNPINADALTNVNTPEELETIKRMLHQKIATT